MTWAQAAAAAANTKRDFWIEAVRASVFSRYPKTLAYLAEAERQEAMHRDCGVTDDCQRGLAGSVKQK